jgi:hypothetical protein
MHVYLLKLVRRYGREHVLTGVMHPSHSHPSIPIPNHRYVINIGRMNVLGPHH